MLMKEAKRKGNKMRNNNLMANDIFGEKTYLNVPSRKLSAGSVKKFDGVNDMYIPPQHKEDNIDVIVKKYGQGTGYAKWQKERYPVKVDIPLLQARMMGKVDSDGYPIDAKNAKVFK